MRLVAAVLSVCLAFSAHASELRPARFISADSTARADETGGELSAWAVSCAARRLSRGKDLRRNVRVLGTVGAVYETSYTSNLPVGDKGAKVPVQTIDLTSGRVDVVLGPNPEARGAALFGPDKVIAITTGGRLAMQVTDESIVVAALDGAALLGIGSKFRPLPSGRLHKIHRKTGRQEERALPEAPVLEAKRTLTMALEGDSQFSLDVRPGAGGRATRLTLFHSGGARVREDVETESLTVPLVLPRAGTYFAIARSLDEDGFEGPPSKALRVRVLGLAPGQLTTATEPLLLDRGQRLRLLGTTGLEMRYGQSPGYYPAQETVGLPHGEATTVEFRDPAAKENTVTLRLSPLVLEARAVIRPRTATWPKTPLDLSVTIRDGAGKVAEVPRGYRIDVTINGASHPVVFTRVGDADVATLAPVSGTGPWVVRLHLVDREGRTVAHDFVEVASDVAPAMR